ncbi:unnamed protein product [Ostreobium quekettii]|uniref:C2 domain-containing protein n=1 Tax=Ostreobium quekettii TaxID=121088 RepID=A0A8S1J2S1_9CHLO|nr:unnamed protein product [Ostreobium quekettii]
MEITFDHEAPRFSNMRRRSSRKDSDLNAVVDVRYTGGMRMLLVLEVGGGRWRLKVPVVVSDLDLESALWFKVRLAPLSPYIGTLSFAFVAPPNIQVQLAPYNRIQLMRTPGLQNFLTRFLTEDLPGMMVLPRRIEANIPPAVTAVAEAAVGRDAVMRAVASAVLQADALEYSLHAALPLGPQKPAGGVSLPESFQGELTVNLQEGRDLPVWGFPWQSNPFCRLVLGKQALLSKKENETSWKGSHRAPLWNQEFELLVEDLDTQVLEVFIMDSHMTARPDVGKVVLPLARLRPDECLSVWLPVLPINAGQQAQGELKLDLTYRPFQDDTYDSGYREAEAFQQELQTITDVKSAAAATSRAGAAASAAFEAVAMARAAAARAANRAQKAAMMATNMALTGSRDGEEEYDEDDDEYDSDEDDLDWDPDTYEPGEIEVKTIDSDVYRPAGVMDEDGDAEDAEDKEGAGEVWESEPRTGGERQEELVVAAVVNEASAALSRYEQDILQEVKTELGDDSPDLIAAVEIVDEQFADNAAFGNVVNAPAGDAPTTATNEGENGKVAVSGSKDEHDLGRQNGSLLTFDEDEESWMDSNPYGFDGGYETGSMDGGQAAAREQVSWRPLVTASQANLAREMAGTSAAGHPVADGGYTAQVNGGGNGRADAENGQVGVGAGHELRPATTDGFASGTDDVTGRPAHEQAEANSSTRDVTDLLAQQQPSTSAPDIGASVATTSNLFDQSRSFLEPGAGGASSSGGLPAGTESLPEDILPLVSSAAGQKRKREGEPQRKGPWWSLLRRIGRRADDEGRGEGPQSSREPAKEEGTNNGQRAAWWSWAASLLARRPEKEQRRPRKKRRSSKGPKLGKSRSRKPPAGMGSVVVPKEVPLEDIAREVVRMKEKNSEQEDERMDRMYNEAVEQSDRKWVMLLFFLSAVSVGLLMIVAYRLDQFP